MSPSVKASNPSPPTGVWPLPRHEVRSADGTVVRGYWSEAASPASRRSRTSLSGVSTLVLAGDLAETVPDVWQPQVDYLAGMGLRFVTWEYRGTRRAENGAVAGDRYDVAAHLEDLRAVLRTAQAEDERTCLVASGVGVRIAVEAALAMPELVHALVLIGGAAGLRYELLCRASWFATRVAQRVLGAGPLDETQPAQLPGRPQLALVEAVTRGVDRVMRFGEMSLVEPAVIRSDPSPLAPLEATSTSLRRLGTAPIVQQAARVEQPTLVLCGDSDPRMPAAMAHQLARRLPRSWVRIIPRSGSRLAVELPDLVNLEIERFLNALPPSAESPS